MDSFEPVERTRFQTTNSTPESKKISTGSKPLRHKVWRGKEPLKNRRKYTYYVSLCKRKTYTPEEERLNCFCAGIGAKTV